MVFRFERKPNSVRTGTNPESFEEVWVAAGETSAAIVKAYALQATPYMVASGVSILFRDSIDVSEQGHAVYHVTPRYVTQDQQKPPAGSLKFAFSTTGGTFHITHSRSTVNRYPTASVDYKQAINVRKNGDDLDIDGTDIVITALKLSYTFNHPLGQVNEDFARAVAGVTAYANSVAFRGFAAGEVLFLGADGSDGTNSEAEVTYHFAAEKNLQDHIIGSITGIAKDGHDLLWVNSKKSVDGGKPTIIPLGVYIERVYQRTNLKAALGWG